MNIGIVEGETTIKAMLTDVSAKGQEQLKLSTDASVTYEKGTEIETSKDAYASKDMSCTHCHSKEVKDFQKSVHLNKVSCIDCHGGDISINGTVSIYAMNGNFTDIQIKTNIINICSDCHSEIVNQYKDSVHYNILREKGVASCTDCHSAHDILSYKDPNSMTYFENVPILCANCHENQTKMSAWYYGIQTDRFDTYKKSYHYKAIMLRKGSENANERLSGGRGLATCSDCHESHNTRNESDPNSAIYPTNLVKTCEKPGCHSEQQKALIYGGKVHEGQSVYLLPTKIDLKALVTYFYIAMIIFELSFTFGLIALGIYSKIDIKKRSNHRKE